MKILVRIVPGGIVELPEGWPVPRIGEGWSSPDCPSGTVGSVSHYPNGEHEDGKSISEPMVYVVVHSDML